MKIKVKVPCPNCDGRGGIWQVKRDAYGQHQAWVPCGHCDYGEVEKWLPVSEEAFNRLLADIQAVA